VPATHDVVWIEGADAVSFADGQLSQDVAAMAPGEVRRSLLLEPRGKLRGIVWVLRGEGVVGLATWAGTGHGAAADLQRFLFRVDATVAVDAAVAGSWWPTLPAPDSATGWVGERSSFRAVLPPGRVPAAISVGDAPHESPVPTTDEVALWRIRAGEPVFGIDVDEDTIPQETGLVGEAVSFTKGCYLGQELVARIDSRGHVNRMLRRVTIDGAPEAGAGIFIGEAAVGTLATMAAAGEGTEALALVRREAEPGSRGVVRWPGGEAPAQIVEIPR